ncbi:hypothetical protein GYA27_03425 [candidate division WWE3 bacterium]|uniref:Protein kinase domain-containing protein n=1 Tax=candidate division WWE3 bacterium TaxID=2053526 RepID=A0A7X9HH44_UNCKA|nr:hypothetical protein [candidate division WWE3 bacterium]
MLGNYEKPESSGEVGGGIDPKLGSEYLDKGFTLGKRIGGGFEGTVYRATDANGTEIVIKRPNPGQERQNASEYHMLRTLQDVYCELPDGKKYPVTPHLAEGNGNLSSTQGFAMEYLDGMSLDDYAQKINGGVMPLEASLHYLDFFTQCQRKGILTGDIKRENLIVQEDLETGNLVYRYMDVGVFRRFEELRYTSSTERANGLYKNYMFDEIKLLTSMLESTALWDETSITQNKNKWVDLMHDVYLNRADKLSLRNIERYAETGDMQRVETNFCLKYLSRIIPWESVIDADLIEEFNRDFIALTYYKITSTLDVESDEEKKEMLDSFRANLPKDTAEIFNEEIMTRIDRLLSAKTQEFFPNVHTTEPTEAEIIAKEKQINLILYERFKKIDSFGDYLQSIYSHKDDRASLMYYIILNGKRDAYDYKDYANVLDSFARDYKEQDKGDIELLFDLMSQEEPLPGGLTEHDTTKYTIAVDLISTAVNLARITKLEYDNEEDQSIFQKEAEKNKSLAELISQKLKIAGDAFGKYLKSDFDEQLLEKFWEPLKELTDLYEALHGTGYNSDSVSEIF